MKKIHIFKHIGSHETYVKVRGRWYWVSHGACADRQRLLETFYAAAKSAGVELYRQGVWPTALARAYREHGTSPATVEKTLPQWTEEVGF